MIYIIIYLIGYIIAYYMQRYIDRRDLKDKYSWLFVILNLMISLLSWISVVIVYFKEYTKYNFSKPPKFL